MDFAVKTVVFVLLFAGVFGRTLPVENDNENGSENNNTVLELSEENAKVCNGSALEGNIETNSSNESVCPTPQCADGSCRIETPPGHLCPTCICDVYREKNDFEPLAESSEESSFESQNTTGDAEGSNISAACNESSVDSSSDIKCNPEKYDTNSAGTTVVEAYYVKRKEGYVILQEDAAQASEGPEIADSDINDIRDAPASRKKGPRRRRSANVQTDQQRWTVLQQDQVVQNAQDSGEGDELEREAVDENGEGYDELQIFREGSESEDSTSNEITDLYNEESILWEKSVPGCPTPLCENSSCRIGVLPGHQCPTCICSRSGHDRQP